MKFIDRRGIIAGLGGAAVMLGSGLPAEAAEKHFSSYRHVDGPRSRVMIVNDLSGDIDGLFSTVHGLLSPSAQVQGIVATSTFHGSETAEVAIDLAKKILELMGLVGKVPLSLGASRPMRDPATPIDCPGARAIIAEAMREDTKLPLYVCVGGGLTEVASAILLEPRVADRITLVWIGGNAYPDGGEENNVLIDEASTRFIFNDSRVRMWQVPSTAYSTCQISDTEIQAFIAPHGQIGAWLYEQVAEASQRIKTFVVNKDNPWNTGETWTLGDNPLVVLTALTAWVPSDFSGRFRYEGTGGSLFRTAPAPKIDSKGRYTARSNGRVIRIYDTIDTRLMLNDFFAKMRMNYPTS